MRKFFFEHFYFIVMNLNIQPFLKEIGKETMYFQGKV